MKVFKVVEELDNNNLIVTIALGGLFVLAVYLGYVIGKGIWS